MPMATFRRSMFNSAFVVMPLAAIVLGSMVTATPGAAGTEALVLSVSPIAPAQAPVQSHRVVNPSVNHIVSWMSSVGAGAAIADLDGDAYANDACLVDPRSDSVSLHHIAGAGAGGNPPRTLLDKNGIPAGAGAPALPYDGSEQAPMGCRLADMDQNGWTDVLVYFWGRGPVAFLNRGGWEFQPHEVLPGGADLDWNTNTALFSDLNGDGVLDIFIGNYFPDGSQLLDKESTKPVEMNDSMSGAVNGGRNHVLLGRPGAPEVAYDLVADAFPDDESLGWTLAAATADINGDSLPELYVANDFGPDRFFVNRSRNGRLALENVTGSQGLLGTKSTTIGRDSFKGMGATIADIDRDGKHDIYVSTITQRFGLFEGQMLFLGDGRTPDGVPTFRPGAETLGLTRTAFAWDNKVGDLDNDGQVELLQATGFVRGGVNRWPEIQELALANEATTADPRAWPDLTGADISGAAPRVVMTATQDGKYTNIAEISGLDDAGLMRGIALADVDGDGDLDWIEGNQWADSRLVRNDHAGGGAFTGLRILRAADGANRGPTGERRAPQVFEGLRAQHELGATAALGAAATLTSATGAKYLSYVDGGNGHSGQSSTDIHYGLGPDPEDRNPVSITWRDAAGHVQTAEVVVGRGWHTVVLP